MATTRTVKSVVVQTMTEIMIIEARLVMEGDVYLRENMGNIEGFTVDDAEFSVNANGNRIIDIYGVNGEQVVLDPHSHIQVVRTTVEVQ